jgi:hypothetical protein
MTMTALDFERIKQLNARYCHTIDFADGAGFATCFAPDASFEAPGELRRGTEDLRSFAVDVAARSLGHVRHCIVSSLIDGDGRKGRAVSYAVMTRDFGPPIGRGQVTHSAMLSSGVYSDELVKADDGWVFAKRTFRFDGMADARELLGAPLAIEPVDAGAAGTGLTALDHEAIGQLLARYCYTLDFHDHDGLVGCFASDGVFEAVSAPEAGGHFRAQGDQQLREFAAAVAAKGQGHSRHASLAARIEGDGQRAHVWSYCLNPLDYLAGYVPIGDGRFGERMNPTIGMTGVYFDELVKVAGRWQIERREFRHDGSPGVDQLFIASAR